MKTKPPSLSSALKLLEDMQKSDPEAFDQLISTRIPTKDERQVFSVLQILNELYGNPELRLGCIYNKESGKTERILICNKETVDKHAEPPIPTL